MVYAMQLSFDFPQSASVPEHKTVIQRVFGRCIY